MALNIDRLTPQRSFEMAVHNPHVETTEQHLPHRHFINDGVEPFDEQKLDVRRLAGHCDRSLWLDSGMRDDSRERVRSLLKSRGRSAAEPAHADIGFVREMLPPRFAFGCPACLVHATNKTGKDVSTIPSTDAAVVGRRSNVCAAAAMILVNRRYAVLPLRTSL